jgi:hypothetical protein
MQWNIPLSIYITITYDADADRGPEFLHAIIGSSKILRVFYA